MSRMKREGTGDRRVEKTSLLGVSDTFPPNPPAGGRDGEDQPELPVRAGLSPCYTGAEVGIDV